MSNGEPKIRTTSAFNKVQVEFELSFDEEGFAVNCNVSCHDKDWQFNDSTIPAYLILITKNICTEMGLNFQTLLTNTLVAEEKSRDKWVYSTEIGDA